MDKSIIITQVTTLFLIMAVGFFARKRNILNPELNKGLTDLLLNVTAPITAISSFSFAFSREMLIGAGMVFAFAIAIHSFAIVFSKLLYFGFPSPTNKVLRFATVFSNCGFMGYPVMGSLFGNLGIFYTSIYVATFTFFIWTFGVTIYTGKADVHSLKKALGNPGVIAVFAGMLIFLFSVKLPFPVSETLRIVGSMTTPISMIVIGSMLADIKPADLFSGWAIYYGAIIRLIVMPLITLGALTLLGFKGILLGVCVLAVGMPAAALSVSFAEKNNGDSAFASRLVFLSTILSVITIPIMIWLM